MKPIEQLQEILCTVESVEKDVNKLKTGTLMEGIKNKKLIFFIHKDKSPFCKESKRFIGYEISGKYYNYEVKIYNYSKFKKLGNHLTQKHLMMYCNEKRIDFRNINGFLKLDHDGNHLGVQLDITKELYEQEDKVLLDIINFLKG